MIRHQAREQLRVAWRAVSRPVCFLSFRTFTPSVHHRDDHTRESVSVFHPAPDIHPSCLLRLHVSFPLSPCPCPVLSGARQVTVPGSPPATHLRTAFTRPVRPAHDLRSLPVRCSSGYGSRLTSDDLPAPDVRASLVRPVLVLILSCPPLVRLRFLSAPPSSPLFSPHCDSYNVWQLTCPGSAGDAPCCCRAEQKQILHSYSSHIRFRTAVPSLQLSARGRAVFERGSRRDGRTAVRRAIEQRRHQH